MVYDSIVNIEFYKGLSKDIYLGLEFIKNVSPDIDNGVYQINPRVKAIVSEYKTKNVNENGYEGHKKFIDIQYLLRGAEKICCLPIERLHITTPYSEEIDAAFYSACTKPVEVVISNEFFAIYYPQDGHMPQLSVDEPTDVKKVVVKVEIG